MNILVTGGAGFIGSHLVERLLKDGHKVVCVDDLSLGRMENIEGSLGSDDFTFIKMDVLDGGKLGGIFKKHEFDAVFHFAASSDIHKGVENPETDLRKTFLSTFTVLECMRKNKVKEIVFPSSQVIYGDRNGVLSEDSGPLFPISPYGSAKLSSEAFISSYSRLYEIWSLIMRFPNVTGGRATHGVVFDFINKLQEDGTKLAILGDGTQEKPYIYVEDLVDGILFARKNASGRLNYFNIGPMDTTRVSKIAEIVVEEMGLKDVVFEYSGGRGGWSGDVPKFRYDVSKLASLGWRAPRSSDDAVRTAVRAQLAFLKSLKNG